MLRLLPLVVIVASAAACSTTYRGSASGGGAGNDAGITGGGGPTGSTPRTDGSIGSSCGSCDGDLECRVEAPSGYCTKPCSSPLDCPIDTHCYEIQDAPSHYCLRACTTTFECRPQYTCQGDLGQRVCYPSSTASAVSADDRGGGT